MKKYMVVIALLLLAAMALTGCGQSAEKPFCDGSHKKAGFEAPGWQRVSTRR